MILHKEDPKYESFKSLPGIVCGDFNNGIGFYLLDYSPVNNFTTFMMNRTELSIK